MMRKLLGVFGVLCVVLTACKTDLPGVGSGVLDDDDLILVCGDTFALASAIDSCQSIISSPDSFLLGELETDYGIVRADLLTQLACPEGFYYPENAVIDSLCLVMYYRDWLGDGMAPMAISVYSMDRKGLKYFTSQPYTTSVDVSDYCSMEDSTVVLYNERVVLAGNKTDSVFNSSTNSYLPRVRFRIDSASSFARQFASIRTFTTQQEFNDQFRGLYITSTFGSSTMLHVLDMSLVSYYHFSYRKYNSDQDTTVNDTKSFYINSEVRQVNRVFYSDRKGLVDGLRQDANTNYIIAPSGVCTRVSIPISDMRKSMLSRLVSAEDTLRPYVNKAELRVRVLNVDDASSSDHNHWLTPAANMLLVRESSQARFFAERELPSDTVAIVSSLQKGTDKDGNTIYFYKYLLNDLLTAELRHPSELDTLQMVMVPVSIGTSESGVISSVRQSQQMSATVVESASSQEHPMDLEVIYSGF